MNKKIIISVIAVIIVVSVVSLLVYILHSTSKSTSPTLLQEENSFHVFSSPSLSFNFTDNFSLVNSSGLFAYNSSNSAVLYYDSNKSVAITAIQNTSSGNLSHYEATLKAEFSTANYSYRNVSVSGYSGIEVISKYPSISYGVVLIAGPSGHYTAIYITADYSAFIGVINDTLNLMVDTIKFGPSTFI